MRKALIFVVLAGCSVPLFAGNATEVGKDGNPIPSYETIRANVSGESSPSGEITIFLAVCPKGYVEEPTLIGRFPLGTSSANGDTGKTGGIDAVTPSGTDFVKVVFCKKL